MSNSVLVTAASGSGGSWDWSGSAPGRAPGVKVSPGARWDSQAGRNGKGFLGWEGGKEEEWQWASGELEMECECARPRAWSKKGFARRPLGFLGWEL